jgi:hypothetical protein
LRSYVRQDLQTHLTSVQSRLSLNCNLQKRQERARTGTELPWYSECAETFQMMTGVYAGANWTMAAGKMERHPGFAYSAMVIGVGAEPILGLGSLALYSGLSTAPAENLLRRGADYGLSSIGFDNPHTRDLLSTPVIEASKMVFTWGTGKATPKVGRMGQTVLRTTQRALKQVTHEVVTGRLSFQSPLIFQFDPCKLYSGFPVDAIKLQKPWKNNNKYNMQSHSKFLETRLEGLQVNKEFHEVASGGQHVYENFAIAREEARMRANLGDDAVPFLQEIGPYKDKIYTGMKSVDESRGWRLDFDPLNVEKSVHINWWFTPDLMKRNMRYTGAIVVDKATHDMYLDVLSHFPKCDM